MTKFNVGDKVRYLGGDEYASSDDLTVGAVYEINGIDDEGDAFITPDNDDIWHVMDYNEDCFELVDKTPMYYCSACGKQLGEVAVGRQRDNGAYCSYECAEGPQTPVEASPTVIELLANLSRRLHEAERQLKSQAYEINELYKANAEGTVADRG